MAIPEVDAAVCSSLLLVDPRPAATRPKLATPPGSLFRPLGPLRVALPVASREMKQRRHIKNQQRNGFGSKVGYPQSRSKL